MPCISGKFSPDIGPLIDIKVAPAEIVGLGVSRLVTSEPALLDTGATATCISKKVVQSLGLSPIGMRNMVSTTHSSIPVNVYLVDLYLPFGTGYLIEDIHVMEFVQEDKDHFQILLGRDIICRGVFTISFDGHFTFSL
jgi:hypothetical protein